jgi:molecular chaperone DnaK (HSP70)
MLGLEYDEELIQQEKKNNLIFNEFASDERGLVGWKITRKQKEGEPTEEIFYTEELIAVLLKFGKQLSEKQANGTVRDCVITIPSYFTPSQKRMMLDAADIAGLSVL